MNHLSSRGARPRVAPLHALLLALAAALCSCAADPAVRVPELTPAPADLTAPLVAQRLEHSLDAAKAIRIDLRSYQNGSACLTSETWMTRDGIRTDVSEDGARVYSFTVLGSRAQELIPAGAVADAARGPRFEQHEVAEPLELGNPKLVGTKWACHFGDVIGCWLAPDSHYRTMFTPRLPTCQLRGVAQVSGIPCAVLSWESHEDGPDAQGFSQGAVYYLDMQRGWMLRCDQYQQQGARRVERTVLMSIEELPAVKADLFTLQQ